MSMNKFYGVVKVNSRGQIGIPKQTREDFNFSSGDNLALLVGVLPHSKDAMLLMKADEWYGIPDSAPIKNSKNHEFVCFVKLAERGQIVIPKRIRDKYEIEKGLQILILSHDKTDSVILALLNQDSLGKWAANMIEGSK